MTFLSDLKVSDHGNIYAMAYQEMDMSVTQAFPALNLSTLSYIEKIISID